MVNIVAIVGRPNVGKSTLFNRLTESRDAIVKEISGVTRDRIYGKGEWNGKVFSVIDTGGYAVGSEDIFEGEIRRQVDLAIEEATVALQNAAGNFYINDKPTGAVVGQQPFGGARASGTNDKAGSALNLLRWASPRTIKETLVAPEDYRYPFLG